MTVRERLGALDAYFGAGKPATQESAARTVRLLLITGSLLFVAGVLMCVFWISRVGSALLGFGIGELFVAAVVYRRNRRFRLRGTL